MNLKNVVQLLQVKFEMSSFTPVTQQERDFAEKLYNFLMQGVLFEDEDDLYFFEEPDFFHGEEDLDFQEMYAQDEEEDINPEDLESFEDSPAQSTASSSSDPSYVPSSSPMKKPKMKPTFLTQMKEILEVAEKKRGSGWNLPTVKQRYRRIFSSCNTDAAIRTKLNRFKGYVESHGTRVEKLKQIHYYVRQQFDEAKANYKIVHDEDLRRWAYQINCQLLCPNFKASSRWAQSFKAANRIRSRKITRTVTPRFAQEEIALNEKAHAFVQEVVAIKGTFERYVYNTDQSGFNYEMHSGRTLDFQGVKTVTAVVQSKGALTHSYTIQPLIRIDGKLHPILFICLQEARGLPTTKPFLQPTNTYITCSTLVSFNACFTYCSNMRLF